MKYTIKQGGIWDNPEFEIETYSIIEREEEENESICKHAINLGKVEKLDCYKKPFYVNRYQIPAVVIAMNEGRHNSTGVCLHCIIESAKENNL